MPEVKMIKLEKIMPNPFQPRESFPKEKIQELADSIDEVGLIQPITVRKKNGTYEIASGERRWRACKFAGLEEIPAIVKDLDDHQLMLESLIENVHRSDLKPIEKARGLEKVYELAGFEPAKIRSQLKTISDVTTRPSRERVLTPEEEEVKQTADRIGLSYDYQYRLLSQLRLTPEEQKRTLELDIGYEKIASISSIEDKERRKEVIERAPEMERSKVKKISKILQDRKASEAVKTSVSKGEIKPETGEEIASIEKPDFQVRAIRIASKEERYSPDQISTAIKIMREGPEDVAASIAKEEIEPEVGGEIVKVKDSEIRKQAIDIAKSGVYTREGIRTRIAQLEKPEIKLPVEPIEIQIFNKTMWNLERLDERDFFTMGYEKRDFKQFMELLKAKSIKSLVDIRKNPRSRYKPDFNKENLEDELNENGINYVHFPKLGVSRKKREKLAETGDYEWFFKWYDREVIPKMKEVDFESLASPIAILCTEFDPTKCHRHRIALELEKRGLRGFDL